MTGPDELPLDQLRALIDDAWAEMSRASGHLTEREGRFLALLAAATPAAGRILEIGSFKGKSTVGLARVVQRLALDSVAAVDPFTAPSATDPDLKGESSSFGAFSSTLRNAGLEEHVEVHQCLSTGLAARWGDPIRLLWIDGDHTWDGAHSDFVAYRPFLTPGSIVALHDTLSTFEGPIRVFVEDMLASDDFGAAGVVGSISWAQFRPRRPLSDEQRRAKRRLARNAERLASFVKPPRRLGGLEKIRYKLRRAKIPHGSIAPEDWLAMIER